jgi:hypothetical protein
MLASEKNVNIGVKNISDAACFDFQLSLFLLA